MKPAIQQKLAALPDSPGVYIMKNAKGQVFYIGKAKSLRDRVRGYFSGSDTRAFVALLDALLADLEVVLTHTDKEAFLLENELIKQHQPRFNVKLTDDKRFLCLRLDTRAKYPKLQVVRRFAQDGARYFGPYHSASAIREALRMINRHFQLRTCSDQVLANRARPCLQYQIKRCPAPCVFDLSNGEYAENVRNVVTFLEGRQSDLINDLSSRMRAQAVNLAFEAAAVLRDQIHAVERSMERQRMVTSDFANRDIVGMYREGPAIEIHVMRTREGRLIDARRFSSGDTEVPTSEVLADFAGRYYTNDEAPPEEILFPSDMEWCEPLAELLSEQHHKTVRVLAPKRGDKFSLVVLASRNAQQAFVDKQREAGNARTAMEKLQRVFHLQRLPESLECYDISHLQGKQIVASAVRFEQGAPRKDRYRHYKIRSTEGQDDFKSMYEVISRRARRGLEEGDMPDLILIDGGKGQLNAARAALDDHGVDTVDLISLAKSRSLDDDVLDDDSVEDSDAPLVVVEELESADDSSDAASIDDEVERANAAIRAAAENSATSSEVATPQASEHADDVHAHTDERLPKPEKNLGRKARAPADSPRDPSQGSAPRTPERVFVYGQKNAIVLRQNSAELFLLMRARDEAHRFAITFHRKLRGKAGTRSALDSIPGVGPKRRKELLRTFGSVAKIRAATEAQLTEVVGPKLAKALRDALGGVSNSSPTETK